MYQSPIEIIQGELVTEYENGIVKAVQKYKINCNKEELTKALRYDREQYQKGFEEGKLSAQQWIPCSERLPDEEQDVLITDGTLIWVCTLIKADCGYMWEDDYGYWHPMSEWKAWMPLPEPYKEKS